jgi:DNA repair exonuclease SbcCD nuclease subunit
MIKIMKNLQEPHHIFTHVEAIGAKLYEYQIKTSQVNPDDFEIKHLVFSGHIHKHQVIRENWIYIGSLARQDFAEALDPKGFLYIDDHNKLKSWEFIELSDKEFITLEVVPEYNQYGFLDRLPDYKDNSIVRIKFIGEEAWYAGLEKKRITTTLLEKGVHRLFSSFENTTLKSLRAPDITIDSKMEEAIITYAKRESREDLTELGLQIYKEVEELPI